MSSIDKPAGDDIADPNFPTPEQEAVLDAFAEELQAACPDPPLSAALEEALQNEALAFELQKAHSEPPLSAGFRDRLWRHWQAAPAPIWTMRGAFQRNPVLRVAAALLVMSTLAVPITGMVYFLNPPKPEHPVIQVQVPRGNGPGAVAEEIWQPHLETPASPDLEEWLATQVFDDSWMVAVEQQNRLAALSFAWHQRFPISNAGPPPEAGEASWSGEAKGFALRLAWLAPESGRQQDWPNLSAVDLWLEMEHRLALAPSRQQELQAPPEGLVQRFRELWALGGEANRAWLQGWKLVLDGHLDGASLPLPRTLVPEAFPGLSWAQLAWQPDPGDFSSRP
ncbi:MAG: hypothetical protein DWQ01_12090 [Planctomycetota bacterium]|nr:MAG: hypothetical protein DWQ01_12090 [Planctomycetota bacterium]